MLFASTTKEKWTAVRHSDWLLTSARVLGEIYVCGEQLIGDGVDFRWLTPDVTVANDGLLALSVFQYNGYAILTF